MKKWLVTMPVTGIVTLEVEAEDKKGAIEAFWNSNGLPDRPDEWDLCEKIVRGNVFSGMQNEVDVQEANF